MNLQRDWKRSNGDRDEIYKTEAMSGVRGGGCADAPSGGEDG